MEQHIKTNVAKLDCANMDRLRNIVDAVVSNHNHPEHDAEVIALYSGSVVSMTGNGAMLRDLCDILDRMGFLD